MSAATGEETPPPAAPAHPPGSFAELWRVALPLVLSSGSLSLMFVVDRIFLMWSSKEEMAAAMPAGVTYWMIIGMLIGTVGYVNTFVAQYEGAGQKSRVVASVWQGVYLAVVGGLCLLVFIPLADVIFQAAGHTEAVQKLESSYFSILCIGALPMILSAALSAFYSGRGKTLVVMYVNFGISIVNIVLDYVLIFGIQANPEWGIHFSTPAWGIHGAAVATVIAQFLGATAYVVLFLREHNPKEYATRHHRRFDRELFGRLMRYGLPTGFQYLSDIAGFVLFIFLIGQLGTNELAATNLAFNLNSMAFVPMMGIGVAVMTLVGRRIGEGRPELAVRTTWLAFKICAAYMLTFAAVYLFFSDWILMPYAALADPAEFAPLKELVITLLKFVAVYSFFDGMAIVFGSAIRGAGDTRFSLVYTFITGWSLMVLPTFVIWTWFEKDLFLAWAACTVFIVSIGIGFLIRFQTGQWKTMRVIESVDEPTDSSLSVADAENTKAEETHIVDEAAISAHRDNLETSEQANV